MKLWRSDRLDKKCLLKNIANNNVWEYRNIEDARTAAHDRRQSSLQTRTVRSASSTNN